MTRFIPPLLSCFVALSSAYAGPAEDAKAAYSRGDLPAAIAGWTAAIAAEPTVARHYEALGRAQLKAKDAAGAVQTFRDLVERVPDYSRGQYRLAFALRKAGRLDEAAEAYRAYAARAPSDPDAMFGLGRTLEKAGDRAGAADAYRRYVAMETRPTEAKWVKDARARIARLDPGTAAELAASPQPMAAPTPTPTPTPEPVATPTPTPTPVRGSSSAADVRLLTDSPLDGVAPAADPDAAFAAGQYASAATGYAARLAEAPSDVGLHYRHGVSALVAGDPFVAGLAAAEASRLDPASPDAVALARSARAAIDRQRSAPSVTLAAVEAAVAQGRIRTAARLAADLNAVSADPVERATAAWFAARALVAAGRRDAAWQALKRVAAAQPSARVWRRLAAVAETRGDRSTAIALRTLIDALPPATAGAQ